MTGEQRGSRSVLITDGEQRSALAVVRSLGAAGWTCMVGSTPGRSLAGASRFAACEFELPDPAADPERYADAVASLVAQERINVVLPMAEAAVLALLSQREHLGATIPFPDLHTFSAVCDKRGLLRTARDLGIRVPRQQEVAVCDEPVDASLRPPFVLKPHRSVCASEDGSSIRLGVKWAHTRAELESVLVSFPQAGFPILVQEAVVGSGIGIFVLMSDGEAVACFSHRRLREKPPSGGVSVLRQSEPMQESLLSSSVQLLRHYGWSGVAMVEYKVDDSTGEPVLMEVNGRFWGSLQLAIDAGVDFPRLLVDGLNRELSTENAAEYKFIRSRWFWGDVDHLVAVWRDPGSGAIDRLKALAGWIAAFLPGYREEIFRWTDPRPFIVETKAWIRQVVRA